MITEEAFSKYIIAYKNFEQTINRIEEAISGSKYGCNLWESDWYSSVGKMLDTFLDSHFTEKGIDWVYYYLFEDVKDKKIIVEIEDMFGTKVKEFHVNTIDELWNFFLTDKELYFKNV